MTETTGINLNTAEFKKMANQFVKDTGKDLHLLTHEVMRVLVETLYHWTPPPTKGNRGSRGGRAGGKAIVNQDVYHIVNETPQSWLNILYERFGGDWIPSQEWRKKDGTVFLMEKIKVNTTGNKADIDQWHKSQRKSRGRVFTFKGDEARDIGRWRPRNKMLIPKGKAAAYIRDVHKRVGKMKDAWTNSLDALNAKLPVKSKSVPAKWVVAAGNIQGHYGTPSGSLNDNIKRDELGGSLVAVAKASYIRDAENFVARAHNYVQSQVFKKHGERWLEQTIKRHNKAAA